MTFELVYNHPMKITPEIFDEAFWQRCIASMAEQSTRDAVIIVPDASMFTPYRLAWAAHARAEGRAMVMPRMMTLLDWAKRCGAKDWDAEHLSRVLAWAGQLQDTPNFARWLGADAANTSIDGVLGAAERLVAMSDELSLHVLAGRSLESSVEGIQAAVDEVYQLATNGWANDELSVLLQCWRLDVATLPPAVRFLNVLDEMQAQLNNSVYVVRNRPWSPFETWFYEAYSQQHNLEVFDVSAVRSRAPAGAAAAAQCAWASLADVCERVRARADESTADAIEPVQHGALWSAPHAEDEANAVVQQVLAWRADGLKKIGIVALDRAVSRRVWSMLLHHGVAVRDDTGWLLSTSRLASSWHDGLMLWQADAEAAALLSWLAHPVVYSDVPLAHKALLQRYLKEIALRQNQPLKTWRAWADALRHSAPSLALSAQAHAEDCDVHRMATEFIMRAQRAGDTLKKSHTLANWANIIEQWAKDFGLWSAWQSELAGNAGVVWLRLLADWHLIDDALMLDLTALLRVMSSEVERATYRAHDADDEVLLLPLGSTRMRHFDAVWVLGADEAHLPGGLDSVGLLNMSVRTKLGLPNAVSTHAQMQRDFVDVLIGTPRLFGSYCETQNGSPNAPSTWWRQWLRASAQSEHSVALNWREVDAQMASASAAVLNHGVPHKVTASDVNKITACPYQYYVQRSLGVRASELPSDEVSAADKGNLWHEVLAAFHARRNDVVLSERDDVALLTAVVDQKTEALRRTNARYWVVRENFLSWVNAYVAWWQGREAEGWHWQASELSVEVAHDMAHDRLGAQGLKLTWHGTLDQLDARECIDAVTGEVYAERAVIDYKTNHSDAIKDKYLKPISQQEDVQLAFYIHLSRAAEDSALGRITQAGYVGISESIPTAHDKPHQGSSNYPQAWLNAHSNGDADGIEREALRLHHQVGATFERMLHGEPLVAMGQLRVCEYCDVRGLCRKGHTRAVKVGA